MTLRGLPHQIPFRAVSSVDRNKGTGLAIISENGLAGFVSTGSMLLEAMAQTAGAVVFDEGIEGRLAGVDRFQIDERIEVGDRIEIETGKTIQLGDLHRVEVRGTRDGKQIAAAVLYLSTPEGQVR